MKRKKNQRHYFADKGPYFQSYGFSGSHVWMWELDHKESWAPKNWCFWTVVLEKTLESALGCKIKLVNPKRNQSWIFIGRTDTKAEAPILWPFDKTLMLGRLKTEGEGDNRGRDGWMASSTQWTWVWANSESQTLGVGHGQRNLVCCSPWGCKELDMTEQLNWTEWRETEEQRD